MGEETIEVIPTWQRLAEGMLGFGRSSRGAMSHIPYRFHEAPPNLAPVIRRLLDTHHHLRTVDAFTAKAGGGIASRQIIAAVLYGRGFDPGVNYEKHWLDECDRLREWREKNP